MIKNISKIDRVTSLRQATATLLSQSIVYERNGVARYFFEEETMFIKRDNTNVVLNINSCLETSKPVFPLSFFCGDNQEFAELIARQLESIIKKKFQDVARDSYDRGFADAKAKRKKDNWTNIPFSFE